MYNLTRHYTNKVLRFLYLGIYKLKESTYMCEIKTHIKGTCIVNWLHRYLYDCLCKEDILIYRTFIFLYLGC